MFTRVTDMLWTRLSSRQASATLTPFAKPTGSIGTEPGMQRHAMVSGRECHCPMQVQDPPPRALLQYKHEMDRGKPREQTCRLAGPQPTSCKQSRPRSWFGTLAMMLSPREWLGDPVWGQRDIQNGASPMAWMLLGSSGHPTLPGSGGWGGQHLGHARVGGG